jgi:hypothetical protein
MLASSTADDGLAFAAELSDMPIIFKKLSFAPFIF